MSNLEEHARKELELVGEEPEVIDWFCRVIAEFSSMSHSGSSAFITTHMLHELLQFKNLSPLTNNPDEWIDVSDYADGKPMWQNKRNSEAFSTDHGETYWLVSERYTRGWKSLWLRITPKHHTVKITA